ncbi:MAG: tetratricopeptide repeat protein, partial [Bacteroidota bacterium]
MKLLTCSFSLIFSLFIFLPCTHAQSISDEELESLISEARDFRKNESYDKAVLSFEKTLPAYKERENHQEYIKVLSALSQIRSIQSKYKAQSLYLEKAFAYGKEHKLLEESWFHEVYTNRAYYYEKTGFFEKAYADLLIALELIKKAEEVDPSALSRQYKALGRLSAYLGSQRKAGEFYQKSLELNRKTFGENSDRVAKDYNVLGVDQEKKGNYVKAIEYQQASIRIFTRIGKSRHSDIADSYNNLGNAHFFLNQLDKALENYRKAEEIYRNSLGPNALNTAYATMNIGIIFAVKGDFETALTYFGKEREIKQNLFGGPHPDLIYSYNNLGAAYNRMGDYEKALEMQLKALEIAKEVHPPRHPKMAKVYEATAEASKLLGKTDQALDYYQKSLIAGSLNFENQELDSYPETSDYLDPANRLACYREKAKLLKLKVEKEGADASTYFPIAIRQVFAAIDLLDFMRNSYKSEASSTHWQRASIDYYELGIE